MTTRAQKIYNHEQSMKRGYSEWIPDEFTDFSFVDRIIKNMFVPVRPNCFKLKDLTIEGLDKQ